jgi:hypothetical protein
VSRRPHIAAVICAGALLVAVLAAAAAHAGGGPCGGVEVAKPKTRVNPGGHPPLAIGDSTMLLALPALAHEGYEVNAHGCRQMDEGLGVMKEAKRQHRLPHLIVIALGADASVSPGQIDEAFHIAGRRRVIGLVTPLELGGGTSSDADAVRAGAKRHAKRAILLDWVAYSRGHSSWFQPDGLHLTFAGAAGFARLLHKALPYARPGAFPGRPPPGRTGLGEGHPAR